MTASTALPKQQLRQRMKRLRAELGAELHVMKSRQICDRLWQFYTAGHWKMRSSNPMVGAYMPHHAEVDLLPFIERCWQEGIRVAVPKVIPDTKRMRMHWIRSLEELESGKYGIREPMAHTPIVDSVAELDLWLIPGLAFDYRLARLGYGGGYYDRLLGTFSQCEGQRPKRVAAAFDLQIVDTVPVESHDVRLDAIVTESRLIVSCGGR